MASQGYPNAQVQKFSSKGIGGSGYQISTERLRPGRGEPGQVGAR